MLITAYKRKFVGRYKRLAENQNSWKARRRKNEKISY